MIRRGRKSLKGNFVKGKIQQALKHQASKELNCLPKPGPHLPKDYALNHGHYLRREPKK